jgi:hypothetical protein
MKPELIGKNWYFIGHISHLAEKDVGTYPSLLIDW